MTRGLSNHVSVGEGTSRNRPGRRTRTQDGWQWCTGMIWGVQECRKPRAQRGEKACQRDRIMTLESKEAGGGAG